MFQLYWTWDYSVGLRAQLQYTDVTHTSIQSTGELIMQRERGKQTYINMLQEQTIYIQVSKKGFIVAQKLDKL